MNWSLLNCEASCKQVGNVLSREGEQDRGRMPSVKWIGLSSFGVVQMSNEKEQRPYFPLYWLVNSDPRILIMVYDNPHTTGP